MSLHAFIAECQAMKGGAERANYGLFIERFCKALDLPTPNYGAGGVLGDYQLDAPLKGGSLKSDATGYIDCYRKHHFILEAKQSRTAEGKKTPLQPGLPVAETPADPAPGAYDKLMQGALRQAKHYAANLPQDHPWPPFIIVADVGRAFELYFDYAGNGRGYDVFPNRQSYRITIDQLADAEVRETFRAIWTNPSQIDPRLQSVAVTREVATRLAHVSAFLDETQRLKAKTAADLGRLREEAALFIMRLLFCMFAEDTDLLPKGRFKAFLARCLDTEGTGSLKSEVFQRGLQDIWSAMGKAPPHDRWSPALEATVAYFNGRLFADQSTYPLDYTAVSELNAAAAHEWSKVEPAIFGTFLEQALSSKDRKRLGAHYTPRPYVERLVEAAIFAVLRPEWEAAEAAIEASLETDPAAALATATAFHARLATLRILDPACGTGNFLYVALELLLKLESAVVARIRSLGGKAEPSITPANFAGLELNPRAAVIAELVLWIGWLRFRIANDATIPHEPILGRTASINFGRHGGYDALLVLNDYGSPDLANPRSAPWPEADFIVGNPPFIGGKDLRSKLDSGYAEALWAANPRVPASADLVMQWWDRAADLLTQPSSPLIRFGFVTTNSITQSFSRRVIEARLSPPSREPQATEGQPEKGGEKIASRLCLPSPITRGPRPPRTLPRFASP